MNTILLEKKFPTGQTLQVVKGDITTETVDAIVNAANEDLAHGGGLAFAILRRGGPIIQEESTNWIRTHGPVPHHKPAWTSGGNLPARYVIHAVGPMWEGKEEDDKKLADAVTGSLQVAEELKCRSIAMPAISTGIFGFPKDRAADITFRAIDQYFAANSPVTLEVVRITLFDKATLSEFTKAWQAH